MRNKSVTQVTKASTIQKYWSGLSWSIFAIVIKAILGIGASVIFVRYLGGTGYGQVVVMADFVTMAIVLLSQGLGVVQTRVIPQLMVRKEYGQVKDFVFKVFAYRWGISLLTSGLIYANLRNIQSVFFKGVDPNLLLVAAVLIPIQMIATCFRGVLEVTFHQKFVSLADIGLLIFRLLIVVPVIYYDLGIVWFFVTQAMADFIASVLYGYAFKKKVWVLVKKASRFSYGGKMWSTGLVMMFILLSSKFLGKEMDTQILSFRLGANGLSEIALYSVSFMLVMRTLSFIGIGSGGVANLTQAAMSELKANKDLSAIASLYESQISLFYFIALPMVFGGSVLANNVLNLMYGQIFYGKGLVCSMLFLILGGTLINNINYFAIYSLGKEQFLLINRFVWGVANIILSYLLSYRGAIGVALATGICLIGITIFETFYVNSIMRPKYPLKCLGKILVGSSIMVMFVKAFLFFLRNFDELVVISGAVVLGAVVYMCCMVLLKPFKSSNIGSNFSFFPMRLFIRNI